MAGVYVLPTSVVPALTSLPVIVQPAKGNLASSQVFIKPTVGYLLVLVSIVVFSLLDTSSGVNHRASCLPLHVLLNDVLSVKSFISKSLDSWSQEFVQERLPRLVKSVAVTNLLVSP